jgi:hypothetical protein
LARKLVLLYQSITQCVQVKVKLPVVNWAPHNEDMDWRYSSNILDLGRRRRWVVSFTSWPLALQGKSP